MDRKDESDPSNATNAQTTTHENTKKKYEKTLLLIHQCADVDIFESIMHCESVKEAWDILEKVYAADEKLKKVKLHALRRQYELLHTLFNFSNWSPFHHFFASGVLG